MGIFTFSCSKKSNDSNPGDVSNPVVAYASVDKVEATIGDIITYQLNLDYSEGIQAETSNLKKYFDDFTITGEKKEKPKLIDNRLVATYIYKLQAKQLGSYIIQPVEINYIVPSALEKKYGKNGKVKTSKIFIEIKSVLKPADKDKDIEDIKPLEEISVLSKTMVAAICLVIFMILLTLYLLRKRLRKPKKELLPHEKAFKELNGLKEQKLLEKNEFKTFYFGLSEITRRYLKNRFDLSALEKVSDELIADINKVSEISHDKKAFLRTFFERTDFYKFTDSRSSSREATELFDKAFNFVSDTAKVPEIVEEKR